MTDHRDNDNGDDALDWVSGECADDRHAGIEARLLGDSDFRDDVAALEESIALLSLAAPEVSPRLELRQQLMARIRLGGSELEQEQVGENVSKLHPGGSPAARSSGINFREILAWAATVAFASLAWFSWYELRISNDQVVVLQDKLSEHREMAKLEIAALNATIDDYKSGVALVVWDQENQTGILKLEKMPPLTPDKDYQLWVVDPSYENPVDSGVIQVDASGFARVRFKPTMAIASADNFAISIERKGGVPVVEGEIVLLSP